MNENLEHNDLILKWFNGELSREESQQLEASGLDDLRYVLEDIGTWKLPPFDTKKGLENLEQKKADELSRRKPKVIRIAPILRYAAAIAILIAAYFSWDVFIKPNEIKIATAVGETITHVLPDGSVIQLDAASEIAYNAKKWDDSRIVNLKGQAFFKVNKGSLFKVALPMGSVNVLGTHFNVKTGQYSMEVECYEGTIEVHTEAGKIKLTGQEGAIFQKSKLNKYEITGDQPGWMNSYTIYNKTPLSRVIADLKKYYNVKINLPKKYAELEFSGKVPHDNLELALKTIFAPMEISYSLKNDKEVIFNN